MNGDEVLQIDPRFLPVLKAIPESAKRIGYPNFIEWILFSTGFLGSIYGLGFELYPFALLCFIAFTLSIISFAFRCKTREVPFNYEYDLSQVCKQADDIVSAIERKLNILIPIRKVCTVGCKDFFQCHEEGNSSTLRISSKVFGLLTAPEFEFLVLRQYFLSKNFRDYLLLRKPEKIRSAIGFCILVFLVTLPISRFSSPKGPVFAAILNSALGAGSVFLGLLMRGDQDSAGYDSLKITRNLPCAESAIRKWRPRVYETRLPKSWETNFAEERVKALHKLIRESGLQFEPPQKPWFSSNA